MKIARLLALVWVTSLVFPARSSADGFGMQELYRLDRLPVLKESVKIGSVSSYDRAGGNDDGFSGKYSFVRKEPEGLVIADLKGPGVIYRIWTPTPTDDPVEFFFDGETQPRLEVKFRELFLGHHPCFPRPLVGFGAGGYYSYVPLPFATSCVVRVRAPRVQFYQINYALYGPNSGMSTFSPELSAEYLRERGQTQALFNSTGHDLTRYTAPPGASLQTARASIVIPPGTSQRVFHTTRGGRIVGLRFTPTEALAGKARDLLLKISFDGAAPTVMCPLGDFFGYAWGEPATRSLLVGTVGATNYCYFPMPFKHEATVEIMSERKVPVELQAEIIHTTVPRASNEGGFHAVWRRENPTKLGEPYTFLETTGRGHLVGVVLQAQGFEPGKTLFFEGDDETTVDGEMVIHGTGSEDFFNGGWYDVPDRWEKRLSFPLSGCLGYAKHLGRTGAYRFFLGDVYAYHQSLRQTIEHSGEKNNIPTDYCSVAYFYSAAPPTAILPPPPLKDRAVLDPKEVAFSAWWQTPIHAWSFERATLSRKKEMIEKQEVRYLSLAATNGDWFGPHFLSPIVDVPTAGRYAVYIEAVKGPAQARIQLFQNENSVSEPVDLYAEKPAKSERLLLGKLDLEEGKNNLMFKLVGKNENSTGLGLDLVQIICVHE